MALCLEDGTGQFSFQVRYAGVVEIDAGAVIKVDLDDPINNGALTAVHRWRHRRDGASLHARTRDRTLRKPHNGL